MTITYLLALSGGAKESGQEGHAVLVRLAASSAITMMTRMTMRLMTNGGNTKGGGAEAVPCSRLPPLSAVSQHVEEGGEMMKQTTEKRTRRTT